VALRVLFGVLIAGVLWVAWTAISVWTSFRSIETIDVDVDQARQAIAAMPDSERPPPPPLEPEPPPADQDPTNPDPAPVTTPAPEPPPGEPEPPTEVPPEIPGDQVPYDPAFSSSPPVPDEAFDAFLIIGSDAREDRSGSRADVIILALLPKDGTPPILVSLPRDLWVDIPCWDRPNRINAALNGCGDAASGPELLALTVADFTGIQPDHFALFDFSDFTRVIDGFGGIEICVDNPVREKTLELPAGCSTADGETALMWIRSRRTEEFVDGAWRRVSGVNDITRNERQQEVLLEILKRIKSLDGLTSLVGIVDGIADAVTIDDGFSIGAAIGLAWDLRTVSTSEIVRLRIPVRHYRTETGAQVLLAKESFEDLLAEVWPTTP
jgi:LCP family protein required for cell wall assembly